MIDNAIKTEETEETNDKKATSEEKPESLSQVASPTQWKKSVATVVFGVIIIAILASIIFGKKQTQESTTSSVKTDYSLSAPQATTPNPSPATAPQQQLSMQIQQLKSSLDSGRLAEQEKLYRMRQAAPIEMYTLNTINSNSSVDDLTANSSNSLPLSRHQVAKLKRLMGESDPNSQFQTQVSNDHVITMEAKSIPHLTYTVTQGTLIPGMLQTAIDSSLPGMVKANVTLDVYGAAGNRILIPKGSTLIGQYNAGVSLGQRRVFVVWTRLIRPDGIDVMLGSPGTDSLGQAGLGADKLETHFWARFGQASLLSIIGAGIANAGVTDTDEYNSASAYREALSTNFQQTANSALAATFMIKPTLHIYQGARINVFVNRDLSFYAALRGSTR